MTSAWGVSFGTAWGNAWGAVIGGEEVAKGGGGGGARRRRERARPIIIWREADVNDVVQEAVSVLRAERPAPRKAKKAAALPSVKKVVAEVRRIEPTGPTVEQIMEALARLRAALAEQDDEEAAWLMFST
jgi:hypothetical protein